MKFWKTMAISLILAFSCITFDACNCSRNKVEVSTDLDSDGVISDWETLYEKQDDSSRIIPVSKVIEISNFEELQSINEKTNETNHYLLTKNIDCGGKALNIDLGKSVLYGNNKVIKNFKLDKHDYSYETEPDGEREDIDASVYGFIFNGAGIYDLRLFAGLQTFEINDLKTYTLIAPFVNVANMEGITVKGKIDINRLKTDGLGSNNYLDASLCAVSLKDISSMVSDTYYAPNLREIETIGEIDYKEAITITKVRLGSIIPSLSSNGNLYDTTSSVSISASSTGTICVGGIVGENDGMLSTSNFNGTISANYQSNGSSDQNNFGGIAGKNSKDGEVKNCISSGSIEFTTDKTETSNPKKPTMNFGGAVGRNLGVVDYIENNSKITLTDVSNSYKIQIGGICGSSENGIFSNIINRAEINLNKCADVYVSELVGISQYGYYEKIVDSSKINIDNKDIASTIRLGMLTIFEEYPEGNDDLKYDAKYTPSFSGILMTGSVEVLQKKNTESSSSKFFYNLGLRNPYEYYVIDEETGLPKTELKTDASGNPILDENENEIYEPITATQEPDLYSKIYYLADSYSVRKYNVSGDDKTSETLKFTFAKDSSHADFISEVSSSRLLVSFFVRDLGFRYGLNHNEIDLSGPTNEVDLNKIKFTLTKEKASERYFEEKSYNGDLAYYDKNIEDAITFNKDKDVSHEMYSYLTALLLSDTTKLYTPIKISNKFASCQDENNLDATLTLEYNFAKNMSYLIGLIVGANPTIKELTNSKQDKNDLAGEEVAVKYEKLEVSDSKYRYVFTFNVTPLVLDEDRIQSDYIVYLDFRKANKYPDA